MVAGLFTATRTASKSAISVAGELLEQPEDGRVPGVLVECRHCGTAVDDCAERCPVCDNPGFARYDLRG